MVSRAIGPRKVYAPSIWRLSVSNPTVWSMCWSKRPGVATRMFIRDNLSLSTFRSFPPITRPAENWWYGPMARSTSNICTACCLSVRANIEERGHAPAPELEILSVPRGRPGVPTSVCTEPQAQGSRKPVSSRCQSLQLPEHLFPSMIWVYSSPGYRSSSQTKPSSNLRKTEMSLGLHVQCFLLTSLRRLGYWKVRKC